jgi:hypothetical protein
MVEYVWYVSLKEHHIIIFSVVQLIFMMFDDNDNSNMQVEFDREVLI